MTARARFTLTALALASILVLIVLAMRAGPAAGFNAPLTQRIFYFHVPLAWAAYVAFATTAFASGHYLYRENPVADRIALASVEVGTVFATLALVTGLLWSRVEFGASYSPFSDPKVVSLVVVLLGYVAYLTLRSGIEELGKRRRLAAVFGLLAVIGIPVSYFASRLSVHPEFAREGSGIAGNLLAIMLYGTVAFTLLFAAFVWMRVDLETLRERADLLTQGDSP